MKYQISAFYGAKAFRVGEPASQKPDTLPDRTPVDVVHFSAGILPGSDSGDRIVVATEDGTQYSVLASQVVDRHTSEGDMTMLELNVPRLHKTGRIVVADEILDYGDNGKYVKFHTVGGVELENGMLPPEECQSATLPYAVFERAYPVKPQP